MDKNDNLSHIYRSLQEYTLVALHKQKQKEQELRDYPDLAR